MFNSSELIQFISSHAVNTPNRTFIDAWIKLRARQDSESGKKMIDSYAGRFFNARWLSDYDGPLRHGVMLLTKHSIGFDIERLLNELPSEGEYSERPATSWGMRYYRFIAAKGLYLDIELLRVFLANHPALSLRQICIEANVSRRAIDYALAGQRGLTPASAQKLIPILIEHGYIERY